MYIGVLNEEEWAVQIHRARGRDRSRTIAALALEAERLENESGFKKSFDKVLMGAGEGIYI
jgi:cupin superfamily acireductone dioxygenase involved in methionine salvage